MKFSTKGIVSLICFAFIIGCGSGKESDNASSTFIEEDEALRGLAAEFISTAGDRVFFGYDSSSISSDAEATLVRQVAWLKGHPDRKILIEGHCDERGTREYNLGLGERRADSAAKFLVNQGISGDRVRTISYGKDKQIAAQQSKEEVYRMNRVAIGVIE